MTGNELSSTDKFIKNNVQEQLLKNYSNNTLLRGIIQALPFGAIFDTVVTVSLNNILIDRANHFYDELGKGEITLTPEIINSEDFLHAYFSTFKAAMYTRQRHKIRLFARLLKNGVTNDNLKTSNEYDDYLNILDELTFREIYLLFILDKYESKCDKKDYVNNLQWVNSFWNNFEIEAMSALDFTKDELQAFLSRMERTGCYSYIRGAFWDYKGDRGYLTEPYFKLKQLIEIKKEDLIYYQKL